MKPCPWCGKVEYLRVVPNDVACTACNAHGPDRKKGLSAEQTWDSRGGADLEPIAVAGALRRTLALLQQTRSTTSQADLTLLSRLESKLLGMA